MLHLVTGGSGYFGEALVRALLERGRQVRILDLNPPSPELQPLVEFAHGDIRDPAVVAAAVEGVGCVHHNVAQVPLAKNRALFESVNEGGTRVLLEAALRAQVRKLVYTSSSAVYGVPERNPVTETTTPHPAEAYGRAKLAGERLCSAYRERGLDVSIVRPRTILGLGRLGIFQLLFEWIRTGQNIPVLGRGDNRYQFVHQADLAEACILAGDRVGGDDFNVGAARFGTMRETLEALIRHAGTRSRVRSLPAAPVEWAMRLSGALGLSPLGPYHALMYGRSMYFDTSKAETLLGWRARFDNEQMFIEAYDWYVVHRAEVLARDATSPHRSAMREGVLALVRRVL